jgi:uncharacterized membrane protein
MDQDRLRQLELQVQELQQELQATQAKLQQVHQQIHNLQGGAANITPPNFFKSPYRSHFSLENFIGLRLIHLVGIVVLVIGLSIGVKYAIDRQLISEIARILLAYSSGVLLYLLSWWLRKRYAAFSAILFSGAMASLYFTSYGAFVYYHLLSFPVVFVVMLLLTVFTVYQALTYNRQEIAVLGLVGAYAVPFLISSNAGRAELLFAYIALINTAVVFLGFKKGWNTVVALAQGVTWLLLFGWALTRFTPAMQRTAYVFGGFFFLLFMVDALLPAVLRRQPLTRRQVQQALLNNGLLYTLVAIVYMASNPKVGFALLNAGFSLFAALQALACFLFLPQESMLKKGLTMLALFLLLVFIANRWEGITVTLLWLLLAVGLFSVGVSGKWRWLRLAAMILMGVTLVKLVLLDSLRFSTVQKIVAYLTLGVLLLLVGFFYQRFKEKLFRPDGDASESA